MTATVRYSPKGITAYSPTHEGIVLGPAASPFLRDDVEAWNLAFLSYPYEDMQRDHPDPRFAVHVRRTLQFVIKTGQLDIASLADDRDCVRHWLRLPAPQAVALIRSQVLLSKGFLRPTLPLFATYGQEWLDTIERRSWLCQPHEEVEAVEDLTAAAIFLAKFKK